MAARLRLFVISVAGGSVVALALGLLIQLAGLPRWLTAINGFAVGVGFSAKVRRALGRRTEERFQARAWRARVTDPRGVVVYDGPTPVPEELITITPEMAVAGELFTFDMTPIDEPEAGHEPGRRST